MVKFENRVAQKKISHFIEDSPLVLFLNSKCGDFDQEGAKSYFRKKLTKSLAESQKNNRTINNTNSVGTSFANLRFARASSDQKEHIDLQSKKLHIKSVKNRFVKRALLNRPLLCKNSSAFALTQGSSLMITFQPDTFFLLKDLKDNNKITILGAIYQNYSIDHNQVSNLIKIIESDKIYYNLKNSLESPLFSLINLVKKASSADVLTQSVLDSVSKNLYAKLYYTIANLQKNGVKKD